MFHFILKADTRNCKHCSSCHVELTYNDDVSEGAGIANGRAVPPMMSELVFALIGSKTDAVTNGNHGVRRRSAHLSLAVC